MPYELNLDTPELWWGSIRTKPHHLRNLALRLFGITPSQASCERNFSTLKWMIGDKRTRLDTNKLENMAKIRSYYLTSVKNELSHYGKEISEIELREIANNSAIGEIISLDNNNNTIGSFSENNEQVSQTTLILENIINISQPFFENNSNNSDVDSINETDNLDHNMNFDATTLVNEIFDN